MICGAWHDWAAFENADRYHNTLNGVCFPEIAAKNAPGYQEIQIFRGPSTTMRSSSSQSAALTTEMLLDSLLAKIWTRRMIPGKPGRSYPGLMSRPNTTKL